MWHNFHIFQSSRSSPNFRFCCNRVGCLGVYLHSIFIYWKTCNDSHFVHSDKYNLTSFQHLDTHINLQASAIAIRLWLVGKIQVFFKKNFFCWPFVLNKTHKQFIDPKIYLQIIWNYKSAHITTVFVMSILNKSSCFAGFPIEQ